MKKEFIDLWKASWLFSGRLFDSFRFGRLPFGLTSSALAYLAGLIGLGRFDRAYLAWACAEVSLCPPDLFPACHLLDSPQKPNKVITLPLPCTMR